MERNRSTTGRFKTEYGAKWHQKSDRSGRLFSIKDIRGKRNKIPKTKFEKLVKQGIITDSTKYICSDCIKSKTIPDENMFGPSVPMNSDSCLDNLNISSETENSFQVESSFDFDSPSSYIHSSDVDVSSLSEESRKMEDFIKQYLAELSMSIISDAKELLKGKDLCSVNSLLKYDSSRRLQKRPEELVCLISSLCNIPNFELETEETSSVLVAKIIEIIYSVVNSRLLLPISFMKNLHAYSISHSKQLVQYNNSVGPAGSYSYLQKMDP